MFEDHLTFTDWLRGQINAYLAEKEPKGKQRKGYGDLRKIPNWLSAFNMLATLVGIGLLITSIVFRYRETRKEVR